MREAMVGSLALCSDWLLAWRKVWLDLKIGLVQWLAISMKEAMVGNLDLWFGWKEAILGRLNCAVVGQWHGKGYAWILRLDFAVGSNWHAGGNGWKFGFVELVAIDMKEVMRGFQDWPCVVVCS